MAAPPLLTFPGVSQGVTCLGFTDLPSRLPTQSSTLYNNNISKFLLSIGKSLPDPPIPPPSTRSQAPRKKLGPNAVILLAGMM